ncbi:hypothetical protein [Streptomyces swartbergensis]|uniref:hypothetical protein n=1 Tax=Streptomyces swartbergensis TaxID=487165 RepID=UPI003820BEBA
MIAPAAPGRATGRTCYSSVAIAVLAVLGPKELAEAAAPLSDAARATGADWLIPVVRVGAAVAALGSLLARHAPGAGTFLLAHSFGAKVAFAAAADWDTPDRRSTRDSPTG